MIKHKYNLYNNNIKEKEKFCCKQKIRIEKCKFCFQLSSAPEESLAVENRFKTKYPHCIGAIDRKHVVIQCSAHTGSDHYNYKNSFSKFLMALVNSYYHFMYVDI